MIVSEYVRWLRYYAETDEHDRHPCTCGSRLRQRGGCTRFALAALRRLELPPRFDSAVARLACSLTPAELSRQIEELS